jgi:hypothetical protein
MGCQMFGNDGADSPPGARDQHGLHWVRSQLLCSMRSILIKFSAFICALRTQSQARGAREQALIQTP